MARQRDEHKREQIINTATKLFAKKGYHATSIQDIVTESGLSVGTIYLYFANKEEIFDALLDYGLIAFTEELYTNLSADLREEEIAEAFVTTILDNILENIKLVTILTSELSFQKKLQGFYSKIAEGISEKFINSDDENSLYSMLKMSKKEFSAFVTILISGLSNAMRIASASRGGIIRLDDIKVVMKDIILPSLLERVKTENSK